MVFANVDLAKLRARDTSLVGNSADEVTRPCVIHGADI
jgi:hypothetical protein